MMEAGFCWRCPIRREEEGITVRLKRPVRLSVERPVCVSRRDGACVPLPRLPSDELS